jgi:type II secretory ATPase GspE/PulE/Tfp pilus assembly ATPase PilB-like protein
MIALYVLLGFVLALTVIFLLITIKGLRVVHKSVLTDWEQDKRRTLEAADDTVPIVRLVNAALATAMDQNADALHFAPNAERIVVTLSKDGESISWPPEDNQQLEIPVTLMKPLIDRLKHMARVSLDVRGATLQGQIRLRHQEGNWNVIATFHPSSDASTEIATLQFQAA